MAKAVFTTKVEPTYDDLPEFRYHFPRSYLRQAEAAVGDWAVYYEPRRTSGDLIPRSVDKDSFDEASRPARAGAVRGAMPPASGKGRNAPGGP